MAFTLTNRGLTLAPEAPILCTVTHDNALNFVGLAVEELKFRLYFLCCLGVNRVGFAASFNVSVKQFHCFLPVLMLCLVPSEKPLLYAKAMFFC